MDVVTELNGIFYNSMGWAKGNILKSNFFGGESISEYIVCKHSCMYIDKNNCLLLRENGVGIYF